MTAQPGDIGTTAAPTPREKGIGGKIVVAAFMSGVVAIECLVAYLLFPSPEQVAALAEKNLQMTLPADPDGNAVQGTGKVSENRTLMETDLGDYSVTVPRPNGASSLRVDFHLFGTVPEAEEEEVKLLVERHINRFRDLVLHEIRNSSPEDLADPGLALIKRRILERSNALFGKPLLKSVVFSQFSYFEQ
jgi:flagellar FliL protein